MTGRGRIRIGISGWTYPPWRGAFYPKGLPQKRELAYAASIFGTIEINGTFYGLQRPETFARWYDEVPAGFVFAVKGPRYITHELRLKDCAVPLANFFASGPLRLGAKLGSVLWQLPPSLAFEPVDLAAFLALLPKSQAEAAALATRHDDHLEGRVWLRPLVEAPLRHALEVRHPSFQDRRLPELLAAHGVALVCADGPGRPPRTDLTADFAYLRLHGTDKLYVSGYDAAALEGWASRIDSWSTGLPPGSGEAIAAGADGQPRDVYVYFDNTMQGLAPLDAQALIQRLARGPADLQPWADLR